MKNYTTKAALSSIGLRRLFLCALRAGGLVASRSDLVQKQWDVYRWYFTAGLAFRMQ